MTSSILSPLHYLRRCFHFRSSKSTPILLVPLSIPPLLVLCLILTHLRAYLQSLPLAPLNPHSTQNQFTSTHSKLRIPTITSHLTPHHTSHHVETPPPKLQHPYPPPSLPPDHPNTHLLSAIRAIPNITPRWPSQPRINPAILRTYGPAYSSIIISEKLKIIYVPVFKVGTTSMMWHIANLENNPYILNNTFHSSGALEFVLHDMSSPAWKNHTVYNRSLDDIQRVFDDPSFLKFGFVRNPFDRIISAYLDKIATWPIHSDPYQEQMYSLYGHDVSKRLEANITKPSFPKFLHDVAAVLCLPRTLSTDLNNPDAYEDNTSRRDMHWRPQVELLHPDLIHLDFVGRFENIDNDRQVVLEWMYRHTDRRMPHDSSRKLHATNPGHKIRLYEMLRTDHDLRDLVLDTYKKDFETFHFSTHVPNDR